MNAAATFHCHNPCVQSRALQRTAMVSGGQEQRAIDIPERHRSNIGSAALSFLIMTYMHRPVAHWCTGFVLRGRDNRTDNIESFVRFETCCCSSSAPPSSGRPKTKRLFCGPPRGKCLTSDREAPSMRRHADQRRSGESNSVLYSVACSHFHLFASP